VMLRTDVLDHTGVFDESLRHGAEDLDLWLRVLRRGFAVVDAPYVDSFYRQRPGSMIDDMRALHLDASLRILRTEEARDSAPGLHDAGEATVGRVVAERVANWCVLALIAGQPDEALATLKRLTPSELLALRAGVDLRIVARDALRRAELRFDADGTNELAVWRSSIERIADSVRGVAFGDDQEVPVLGTGANRRTEPATTRAGV